MPYDFSFSRREWWAAVVGAVLLAVLMFAVGFVSGSLWQRRSPSPSPAPAAASANGPAK
jgi:hypothetical protein